MSPFFGTVKMVTLDSVNQQLTRHVWALLSIVALQLSTFRPLLSIPKDRESCVAPASPSTSCATGLGLH